MRFGLAAVLALAFALAACAGPLSDAEAQFEQGRCPQAKQTLESLEAESRGWDDAKRAEYALFRGLTAGALGDRAQAGLWLREAKAIEDTHPSALTPENERRLAVGLRTYDVP